ncbi:MAG: M24 family metallopeptidase [Nanobdellota archaeon]
MSLKSLVRKKGLDSLVLIGENDNDIYYHTGYRGFAILIVKKTSSLMLVPELEYEKAKKTGLNVKPIGRGMKEKLLKKHLKSKKTGIDKKSMSVLEYERLKRLIGGRYYDISEELLSLRSVKTEREVKKIKEACRLGDKVFSKIINDFSFRTEKELADFIKREIRKAGAEPSFEPIAASGKNSSIVHHNNEGKISKGFLLLDYGAKVDGYCSDMSRTIYVGNPKRKEIEEYENLLDIQEESLAKAEKGEKASNVDDHARKNLDKRFIHSLGHGVGLNVHEKPNISPDSKETLEKGNIITIEPGVYEEGKYGIRIEDTAIIMEKGAERLTRSPKELIITER